MVITGLGLEFDFSLSAVQNLSWYEAKNACIRKNEGKEDDPWRLPTKEEFRLIQTLRGISRYNLIRFECVYYWTSESPEDSPHIRAFAWSVLRNNFSEREKARGEGVGVIMVRDL